MIIITIDHLILKITIGGTESIQFYDFLDEDEFTYIHITPVRNTYTTQKNSMYILM